MKDDNNSRINFLKRLFGILISIFTFGYISIKNSNKPVIKRNGINLMTQEEANEHIRNMKTVNETFKPEPPPKSR